MYLPEGVKIDTRKVRFNVVRGALNDIKCTQTQNDNSARIVWCDGFTPPEFFLTLYPHQRLNRIPSMHLMCYKNSTFNALNRMKEINKDLFNFFPQTYLLPDELSKFKSDAAAIEKYIQKKSSKNSNVDPFTWIFKPKSGQCGIGIQLFQDYKQITAQHCGIVQNYIAPHLIDGFKFDFRMYVFIPTLDPLTIYLYKEGLSRFCSGKYVKPNSQNMNDLYIHLTNTSVNVKNQEAKTDILQTFSSVFKKMGKPELWTKIKKVAALSIIAQYHHIVSYIDEQEKLLQKTVNFTNPPIDCSNIPKLHKFQRYFHLVGLDILINDKYEPIVLEMNDRPSMFVTSQEIEKDLKTGLVKELLQMVTLDGSPPGKDARAGKWDQVFPMPGDTEFNKLALDALRQSIPQSSFPVFLQPKPTNQQPKPHQNSTKPNTQNETNNEIIKEQNEKENTPNNQSNETKITAEVQKEPNNTKQSQNRPNSQTKIDKTASVRSSVNQMPLNKKQPAKNKQTATNKSQQIKTTQSQKTKPMPKATMQQQTQVQKTKETPKQSQTQNTKETTQKQTQKPKETQKQTQVQKTKEAQNSKEATQKSKQTQNQEKEPSKQQKTNPQQQKQKETTQNQPKEKESTSQMKQQKTSDTVQKQNAEKETANTIKPETDLVPNQQTEKEPIEQPKEKEPVQTQPKENKPSEKQQEEKKNEQNQPRKPNPTNQKQNETAKQSKPKETKKQTKTIVSQANRVVTDEKAIEIIITYATETKPKIMKKTKDSIKKQMKAANKKETETKTQTESINADQTKKTISLPTQNNDLKKDIRHSTNKLPPLETEKHEIKGKEPTITLTSLPHLDHQ